MHNHYANTRLMLWSEWLLRKDTGATGYPKQSVYTKLVQIRGGAGFNPDFDGDAQEVDKFMTSLKQSDSKLFEITSMCYNIRWASIGNGIYRAVYTNLSNQQSVAKELGMAQSTVSDKLGKVQALLMEYLLDNS